MPGRRVMITPYEPIYLLVTGTRGVMYSPANTDHWSVEPEPLMPRIDIDETGGGAGEGEMTAVCFEQ